MFVMSLSHVFKNKEQQIGISKYRESLYPIEHSHEFYEIEFVLSGRGIHKVGSDQLETQPGDLFFTNIATPHAFCSLNSEEPLVVYNLAFHANLLDNLQITMKNGEPNATGAARFIFSKILSKPYIKLENVSEAENILEQMYREGREEKLLTDNGRLMISHLAQFAHAPHEQAQQQFGEFGVGVAYDGMTIEI